MTTGGFVGGGVIKGGGSISLLLYRSVLLIRLGFRMLHKPRFGFSGFGELLEGVGAALVLWGKSWLRCYTGRHSPHIRGL